MTKLKQPKSAQEVRYLKSKKIDGDGKAKIWVFNPECPDCKEGYLAVPYDDKTGRFKSRGKFFVCTKCGHEKAKAEIKAETPTANIEYTCPHCKVEAAKQAPFKKSKTKILKFECDKCHKQIKVKGA